MTEYGQLHDRERVYGELFRVWNPRGGAKRGILDVAQDSSALWEPYT
jgi:hypothetical protein